MRVVYVAIPYRGLSVQHMIQCIFLMVACFFALLISTGCREAREVDATDHTQDQPLSTSCAERPLPVSERSFKMGVGPHSRHFPKGSPEDVAEMYQLARQAGEILSYNGPWNGWKGKGLSRAISSVVGDAMKHELVLLPQMSFWKMKKNTMIPIFPKGLSEKGSPGCSEPTFRTAFKEEAVRIASLYRPPYCAVGIEVNSYYEFRPEDFDSFVSLYKETYGAIKQVCPNTMVFPTFHYGILLNPLVRKEKGPAWFLIEKFLPELDLIAITSYPSSLFTHAADIPNGYYHQLAAAFPGRRIAFSELGWKTDPKEKDAEKEQAAFLVWFLEEIRDLDVEFVVWTLLHDIRPEGSGLLARPGNAFAGLRRNDGTPKEAWHIWCGTKKLPIRGQQKGPKPSH